MKQGSLGQWLQERCKRERLSLRQAAGKTGLSHSTIGDIINGVQPSAETILKLACGFSGDGEQRLALEDRLMVLAGFRTPRPGEEPNELLAQLIDKERQLTEPQLKMMNRFADFLLGMEGGEALFKKEADNGI
ncbi:hypothetical protein ES705_48256 [subsurface metagenome]